MRKSLFEKKLVTKSYRQFFNHQGNFPIKNSLESDFAKTVQEKYYGPQRIWTILSLLEMSGNGV